VTARDPERILLVRLSHLGDVVHALGVFHALHAAFPRAELAWAIQGEFAELVERLPGLARVVRFERHGGLGAWRRLRAEFHAFRPDWCVDLQGNTKSAAAALLSGARRRFGPGRADWQEPWAAWSARERAPALVAPARHAMQRMQALAAHLVPGGTGPLRLDAALTAGELESGERLLAEHLPREARAPWLLHLSSPEDVRGWPEHRWGELLERLRAESRGALVLSGPAEVELGRRLERAHGADGLVAHWIGQRGLRALAAVFSAAARRELALVACDSGPMHLAAAHGLRVIALAGPQDALRTGPWPLADAHAIVRSPTPPACAPCLSHRCRHAEGPVCMSALGAADVLAAGARRQ